MPVHKLHLSKKDRDFLKELRIEAWECPDCNQKMLPLPKIRVEEKPKPKDNK